MLRQRVITAAVLLGLLAPALWSRVSWPFALVTLLLLAAAGWEWGRLNGLSGPSSMAAAGGLAGALALAWWQQPQLAQGGAFWLLATLVWCVGLSWALGRGVSDWSRQPRWARLLGGWMALALAWWALATLHQLGVAVLLSTLLLVWVADVAAYFGGRAWGRRKLAAEISPGKSWEGAWCGAAAVLALALAWVAAARLWGGWWQDSLFARLWAVAPGWAVAWWMLLTGLSVAGDLFESLVKRSAGVKDSSRLLPGHGGVLDRIDALLPVLPAALAALSLSPGGGR